MNRVTSAESDGQKTSRMRKEGRWQKQKTGSDAQSRRRAETEDHSDFPSAVSVHLLIDLLLAFILCDAVTVASNQCKQSVFHGVWSR